MNLSPVFENAWKEVGNAHTKSPINNQSVLGFALCKFLHPKLVEQHAVYDARVLPKGEFRPNLYIWDDEGEPTVIFMGVIKFQPEGLTTIQQGVKTLCGYASRSVVEVLTKHNDTIDMKVSPNVEFGFFYLSEFTLDEVRRGIAWNIFSHDDLTRFHMAYASIDGVNSFSYQKPVAAGVDK